MRHENWEAALARHIEEYAAKAFEYGVSDCVHFVADWCVLLCGVDPIAPARGAYTDKDTGYAVLASHGETYEGIMDRCFPRHATATHARRGDVVLCVTTDGAAFGVCIGPFALFKTEAQGLARRSLRDCILAWRVG